MDLIYLSLILGFFGLSALFVYGFEMLRRQS